MRRREKEKGVAKGLLPKVEKAARRSSTAQEGGCCAAAVARLSPAATRALLGSRQRAMAATSGASAQSRVSSPTRTKRATQPATPVAPQTHDTLYHTLAAPHEVATVRRDKQGRHEASYSTGVKGARGRDEETLTQARSISILSSHKTAAPSFTHKGKSRLSISHTLATLTPASAPHALNHSIRIEMGQPRVGLVWGYWASKELSQIRLTISIFGPIMVHEREETTGFIIAEFPCKSTKENTEKTRKHKVSSDHLDPSGYQPRPKTCKTQR